MTTLVIGLGQKLAGDDAAGLAVLDELGRRGPKALSLKPARDATALLELLPTRQAVIIVDSVLVEPERVGQVLILDSSDLDPQARDGVSSHGVSVAQALELCRTLHGEPIAPSLRLVAIGIQAPDAYREGLSPSAQRAVHTAATHIQRLAGEHHA